MQLIGVRRSTVYALIKAGKLQTVKLGRATLITMSSLRGLTEAD
ncbi:helix-turn-helix domain-containing protein [uncultured Sphingomonas sp.]|nr:helix-turn-helix domain-containing protein [uncultured Sphingomonas sp.]